MNIESSIPACRAFVLFGATDDLTKRMLWPSLNALDRDGLLPEQFQLIGAATSRFSLPDVISKVKDSIQTSANKDLYSDAAFEAFVKRIDYVPVDIKAAGGLEPLRAALVPAKPLTAKGGIIFYLSTGPQLFGPICLALRALGIVDKLSRIDHYLGKEAVQNLLALRLQIPFLSRYGTPTPSSRYKSPSPKRSELTDAGRFTMAPAHCPIWCKVTCYSYSVWSRWNRRPTTHHRPCVTKK